MKRNPCLVALFSSSGPKPDQRVEAALSRGKKPAAATRWRRQAAGLTLAEGELLDEPIAAVLDYLDQRGREELDDLLSGEKTKNLVVFDFGAGTCDAAMLRLERQHPLLAPQRQPQPVQSKWHDETILAERSYQIWGIDATAGFTRRDGQVAIFALIDHHSA